MRGPQTQPKTVPYTEAFVVAGLYTALWSNAGSVGPIARPLIFVCLFCAALLAIAGRKVRRISTTPTEVLLYAVGLLSAAVSLVRAEDYSITYSIYFLTAIVFISVLARAIGLERITDSAAVAMLFCIATCLIVDGRSLLATLSISMGKSGLMRFSPLGNHPLLTGDIFGAGSILLIRRFYLSRRNLERVASAAGIALAWIFVLAASARSSIIALLASAAFAGLVEFRLLRRSKAAGSALAVIAVLVLLYFAVARPYLAQMLALDSSYRGVGSGATGRTDLWLRGFETLFSDPSRMAFGGALRSSESNVIGFFTENSYLTILLDSGIFVGSALIFMFLRAPFSALKLSRAMPAARNTLAFLPSLFVFLLVQSFFIRDLLGLGSPVALITLFALMSLSMRAQFPAELTKPRELAAVAPVPPAKLIRART